MDIRKKTTLIIRKNKLYFVGNNIVMGTLKWSDSPWDAWKTRIIPKAINIQKAVGGEIILWNPIVGQLREIKLQEA